MLDPQARTFLDRLAAANRPALSTLTPLEARAASAKLSLVCAGTPVPMADVSDRAVPGPRGPIAVRIYTPRDAPRPAPVLVYFHGGGFVIGDLEMVDETCRMLAAQAACIVVSVDYRLAPEHRYPAPREDAYAAATWAVDAAATFGGDPRRVAVGGDSAGGTLAAVVSSMARDSGGPRFALQVLVYPGADRDPTRPSMIAFADDHFLTMETIRWFGRQHVDVAVDPNDPYLTPLAASDLSGLPPALVITAGCDPLRDGGERYAERLREAGVPTESFRYDGAIHGFFVFPAVFDAARDAIARTAAALRNAFERSTESVANAQVGSPPAE